jgi:hypothetical protein
MTEHRMYEELESEVQGPNRVTLDEPLPDGHYPRVWRTVDGDGEWIDARLDEDDRTEIEVDKRLDGAEFVRAVAVPED